GARPADRARVEELQSRVALTARGETFTDHSHRAGNGRRSPGSGLFSGLLQIRPLTMVEEVCFQRKHPFASFPFSRNERSKHHESSSFIVGPLPPPSPPMAVGGRLCCAAVVPGPALALRKVSIGRATFGPGANALGDHQVVLLPICYTT